MREMSFNVEAARRFGVDGAVMLQGMAVWISKNRANERHFHDGRWWTYNSKAALAKLFPFWTEKQLRRIVTNLSNDGALLLGNYSDGSFHNTTWFALSDEVLELLGAGECASETAETGAPSSGDSRHLPPGEGITCPNGQVTESTCPNGQEYLPKRAEDKQIDTNNIPPVSPPEGGENAGAVFDRIMSAWYPEGGKKPDVGEYLSDHDGFYRVCSIVRSPQAVEEALRPWVAAGMNVSLPLWKVLEGDAWREDPFFWLFWQIYPRKIDKDRARRAWAKLKPDRTLSKAILESLRRWKLCDQWQEERFIPHPATWLNGRRWESTPPGMGRSAAAPEPPERTVEEWT